MVMAKKEEEDRKRSKGEQRSFLPTYSIETFEQFPKREKKSKKKKKKIKKIKKKGHGQIWKVWGDEECEKREEPEQKENRERNDRNFRDRRIALLINDPSFQEFHFFRKFLNACVESLPFFINLLGCESYQRFFDIGVDQEISTWGGV